MSGHIAPSRASWMPIVRCCAGVNAANSPETIISPALRSIAAGSSYNIVVAPFERLDQTAGLDQVQVAADRQRPDRTGAPGEVGATGRFTFGPPDGTGLQAALAELPADHVVLQPPP